MEEYELKNLSKYRGNAESPRTAFLYEIKKGMIVFPKRNVPDGKYHSLCKLFREEGMMEVAHRSGGSIIFKRKDGTMTRTFSMGESKQFQVYDVSNEVFEELEQAKAFKESILSYEKMMGVYIYPTSLE